VILKKKLKGEASVIEGEGGRKKDIQRRENELVPESLFGED